MRVYKTQHSYYCGVDLHARSLFVNILDDRGRTRLELDLPSSPAAFLDAIKPYRKGLVVGCECMFAWYWLADLCERETIPFALGHALAMKAIHGGKAKNDKLDAQKIAGLLKGGFFPMAYVYPKDKRETRDLLRPRRLPVTTHGHSQSHTDAARRPSRILTVPMQSVWGGTHDGGLDSSACSRCELSPFGDRACRFEEPSRRNGEVSGASPPGGDSRLSLT